MDILPFTILEFEDRFSTEEDCVSHLIQVRWPDGFICPKCQSRNHKQLSEKLFQCYSCKKQTSVTSGTIFHKTHLPLRVWFRVIYSVAQDKGGTSSSRIASQFGIQQKSAWAMLHKLRFAMRDRNELIKLRGEIELDEAFFNKEARKRQPEPGTETQVLIMVEEKDGHAGRIFAEVCPAATCANIEGLVEFATVYGEKHKFKSDGLHAHNVVRRMGHDLDMKPAPGILGIEKLPWLHTFISLLRRYLVGTYHGVSPSLLQLYLDEFTFRANRRFNHSRIWPSLIRACCFAKPVKIAELNG